MLIILWGDPDNCQSANQHVFVLSQVHNFCAILMAEPDEPDKYKYNLEIPDVGQRSILHMFAERGLTQCAETFLDMPEVRERKQEY